MSTVFGTTSRREADDHRIGLDHLLMSENDPTGIKKKQK